MKPAALLVIAIATALFGQDPAANVNSRYTVESVELSKSIDKRISRNLREEVDALIGRHFDAQAAADFANRIRKEVHLVVRHRVEKGLQPDHVKVVYEARERSWYEDDARVTKLSYHQKQGITAGVEAGFEVGRNRFEAGVQTDADRLLERYSGVNVGFSRPIGDRVRVRFEFETLHQEWNPATETALASRPDVPGIYRERYSMDPSVVFLLAPGLTLSTGVSIDHFQTQYPAARYEAANAVVATLRHRRRWNVSGSDAGQELDAGYGLRAATNVLDSDFVYARHLVDARYAVRHGRTVWTLRGGTGVISGTAPLYERFSLGDSRTLRGWNKFDVAPLGGTRVAWGSAQVRHRAVGVFYDGGAVWDRQEDAEPRHSAGATVAFGALRDGPYLTVAFPLRNGGFTPIFMLGMNF